MNAIPLFYLLVFVFLTACSPGADAQSESQSDGNQQATVMYFTRHAEKDESGGDNPPLLPAGERRAENLAEQLAGEGIDAIYSTNYLRTQDTARPLAEALSLPITDYAADRNTRQQVEEWRQRHAGQTILVVGHSNTIPDLLNELVGNATYGEIDEDEYSLLYRLSIDAKGTAMVDEMRTDNH